MMKHALAAAALLLAATSAFADREVTHRFDSSAPAPGVKHVVIAIPAGEVRVVNGADGQLRVSGYARATYDGENQREKKQEWVNESSVEAYVNGPEAIIRRHLGPHAQGWRPEHFTNYTATVEVPRGTAVEFETSYGEVHMDGSFGDVDIDLRAGEVHVSAPKSEVRDVAASVRVGEVHTTFGNELTTREGVFPGTTHWTNPSGGRAHFRVHVTAGEVHVTLR